MSAIVQRDVSHIGSAQELKRLDEKNHVIDGGIQHLGNLVKFLETLTAKN